MDDRVLDGQARILPKDGSAPWPRVSRRLVRLEVHAMTGCACPDGPEVGLATSAGGGVERRWLER